MVPYILSTAFIQPHFTLETIPLGQYFGICNDMREIFLECFMRNITRKVAFLSAHSPPCGPSKGQSRGCEIEKHLKNPKMCKAGPFHPM